MLKYSFMNNSILLMAFFLVSCGGNPTTNEAAARMGQPAPEFTLADLEGKTHSLKDYRGKVVLLDFWATWCGPCRVSTPALGRLHQKLKARNFAVLSISVDDSADPVKKYVKKQNVPFLTLMADSNVQAEYRVRAIPTFVLVDAEGVIVKIFQGFAPSMEDAWEREILKLLKN